MASFNHFLLRSLKGIMEIVGIPQSTAPCPFRWHAWQNDSKLVSSHASKRTELAQRSQDSADVCFALRTGKLPPPSSVGL